MTTQTETQPPDVRTDREVLRGVTIRFAGDSGDGIQITGGQFTANTAVFGNDLATFPDYPSEIRAPAGTLAGVSGFQVQFASRDIHTPGDRPDVLVVFNPAALKVHIDDLVPNGILIADSTAFNKINLQKAGFASDPLTDGSLSKFRVFAEKITDNTLNVLGDIEAPKRDKQRCKNFYALGMAYWLFNRSLDPTIRWIKKKFAKLPNVVEMNERALRGGYAYCDATGVFQAVAYNVPAAPTEKGTYRHVSGNEAVALGFIAASVLSGRRLFYGAYPITPASDILHELSRHKDFELVIYQAEDEIAAMCGTVGAAYGGALAVTGTSGPGSSLKTEALGLAVITELPVVVVNVQRGGPSTGLPTKSEQADLLHAMFGRHGEGPVVVLAASSPSDCFGMTVEACRLALKYMIPVYLLTDGYLANGAEPWRVPSLDELPKIPVKLSTDPETFGPYVRDPETLARCWAVPGTPGLEHRVGGLEKKEPTGGVSHDPENHEKMCVMRAKKVERVIADVPDLEVDGPDDAPLLILGWGSTLGMIRSAVEEVRSEGLKVAYAHLKYMNPMPANIEEVLKRYPKVLCPEGNLGQLSFLIRAKFLMEVIELHKVQGQPFRTSEIADAIKAVLEGRPVRPPVGS